MKPGEEDTKAHELVLIRRRAPVEEGGHHGGVWKIAYADFMTAMMAFFLVMWLINSTDQKVLTQVANYFNPMRLTDSTPHTRGVNTIESGEQGKEGKQSAVGDPKEKKDAKDKSKEKPKDKAAPAKSDAKEDKEASKEAGKEGKARYAEQALFSDPYGVLARIAAEAETDGPPPVPASKDGSGAGGDVYLDPFDPAAQRTAPEKRSASPKAAPGREAKKAKPAPAEGEAKTPQDTDTSPNVVQGLEAKKVAPAAGGDAKLPQENVVATRETSREASLAAEKAENAAAQELLKSAKQAAAQATAQKAATKDEAARIENEIKQVTSRLQGTIPNIDVTVTDDGVLISLTDDYDFGMFAIASAEPRPAMVVVMEKMAKILQAHPQPLVVRGHTDGRPYRSGSYDNWRLSTARAHMAYYMLVRGGIDEKRFERVEGYADRSLRVPDNPEAAQNRRIEILLRKSKQ